MPQPLTPSQPDLPPACPAAEAALLGAVLLAPQRASELLDGLGAEHVTSPAHQAVLEAVTGLLAAGQLPEPVAVLERLQRTGQARTPVFAGRAAGVVLADLMEAVTTPSAADYWRDLVVGYAARRRLIQLTARLEQAARHAEPDTLADVIAEIRGELDQPPDDQLPTTGRPTAATATAAASGVAGVAGDASGVDQVHDRRRARSWEAA